MIPSNFIQDILNGEAILDDIDAYVDFWHETNLSISLQEFLGFTDYEYDQWMKQGNRILKDVLFCHRNNLRLEDYEQSHGTIEGLSVLKKYIASA